MISHQELPKRFAKIHGLRMAYTEMGSGDPIVFLHGNPTSSYLWRNILPGLADLGRCIAPDLIGMGDSDKLPDSGPDSYLFDEHRYYLDGLLEQLGVDNRVILVLHDWGSGLGFDWANRHRDAVRGIAYMEALVRPASWEEWPEIIRPLFQGFRSEAGEAMVLEKNVFVEKVLPGSVLRGLGAEEMEVYRRPFQCPGEDRRPTLSWPRQIPLDGEPANVTGIAEEYSRWMAVNSIPKLFINAEPGALLTGALREYCRRWPNQREVTVRGSHFLQEDSPGEITRALRDWISQLGPGGLTQPGVNAVG